MYIAQLNDPCRQERMGMKPPYCENVVAVFCPKVMDYINFEGSLRRMTETEYKRTFGVESTLDGSALTYSLLVYGKTGLHIGVYSDGNYHLVLPNEDWYTKNLIELQLRLYEYYRTEHGAPINPARVQMLIHLSWVIREMSLTFVHWCDLGEDSVDIAEHGYPEHWHSFDDEAYGLRKFLDTQLVNL